MGFFRNERYQNTKKLARNGFYLLGGLALSKDDVSQVINLINKD
jgi:hypothetical protein